MSAAKNKSVSKVANERYEAIGMSRDFYIAGFRRMSMVAIVALVVAATSVLSSVALYVWRPAPQNYAITADGRIIPITPMSEGVSQATIADFTARAIVDSFSFDFKNYNRQLGGVKSYYSDSGYNEFMAGIKPLVDEAKDNFYVSQATILSSPIIVKSAVVEGVQKYKLQTVVMVEMIGQTKRALPRKWVVETVVDRVPQSQYPLGIAIARLNAKPYIEQN